MATKKKVITSTQKKLNIIKKASKTKEEPKEKIKGNSKLKIKKAGEIKKKEEPKKKGVASSLKTREELRKEKAKEKKNKDGIIKPAFVEDLMKQYYLDYAMSVITDRSIPDIRDGLKPVQRRILWGVKNVTEYSKSARIVGNVMGKYHPHGDCLKADTKFFMLDGRHLTIQELYESGIEEIDILAYNEKKRDFVEAKAHSFRIGQYAKEIYNIKFHDGMEIECTDNHPFFKIHDNNWEKAENLKVGDYIRGAEVFDEHLMMYNERIISIEVKSYDTAIPMYDFTVDKYENALVFKGELEEGSTLIFAHNSSIYDAMVRMAQDWKMYVPYIDGHGNFGSLDNDPPASSRYSEARVDNNAIEIFFKHNELGMEYQFNYDQKEKEPQYLPAVLPTFLINGTLGAAVGFSTNIPTHNPKEVINTYEAFIQGKLTNKNLRKYLKGPDPIVPCKVIDKGGIDRGYETGKGSFHCMMNYHIEEGSYGRKAIVFTSVLPNTSKAGAIESLADACKNERSPVFNMIADLSDESDMNEIRIVVLLKKGIDINTALEALIAVGFCYSQYSITSVLLVDGRPMRLGIIEMLTYFHKHQRELSERHLTALKNKHKERLVILDGIAHVIKNYDIVSTIIRNAKNKQDAKEKLMKKYKSLNEVQVNAILDTKLISLVNKGDAILTEQKQIKAQIKEIDLKLKDIDGYILGILNELKGTFRAYSQRRSVIVSETSETSK